MKRLITTAILLSTAAFSFLNSQEKVATVLPSKPQVGDEITITYNPKAKAATIRDAKELTAEVLIYRDDDPVTRDLSYPVLIEIPMKQAGSVWKGSFKLEDPRSQLLILQFISGEQKDDNGENVWNVLVHDSKGKPVKGAYRSRGILLQYGGYMSFKHQKDLEQAQEAYLQEKELYPDNWRAHTALWDIWLKEKKDDETKAKVRQELDRLYDQFKNDQNVAVWFLKHFEQTDQQERVDKIREEMLKADPKGRLAHNKQQNAIYREQDPTKRAELLEQFLKDFPKTGDELERFQNQLAGSWVQAKQYEKAVAILNQMANPDPMTFRSLTSQLLEKGERLEEAVAWAQKGIEMVKNADPTRKPSYWNTKVWKGNLEYQHGLLLDTYAQALAKLGRNSEALAVFQEAYDITKGNNANINERVIESYVANGKFDKAIEIAETSIKKGKSNDKLLAHYKAAYTKARGTEEGFDETLKAVSDLAKKELKEKLLKDRVNKPALDFTLQSLDGKAIALADLKGKVVVLDFWATWCGPCVASFPTLQKVYDKYKDHPNVAILAINSWENAKNEEERVQTVREFIEKNKYTFPVLLDEKDKIIGRYGVEGIPTKFVIDKRGMIQFKDIGFSNAQEMLDKMELQFEMLLNDEFYISVK